MIATGLLACLVARADSALVSSYGPPGFDNNVTAMYSDRLAAFALASDNLYNVTGNPLIGAGLGTFTLDSEPLAEAAFALPLNLSGAWMTSFSNLTLPAGAYRRLDSSSPAQRDFQNWIAAFPPDSDVAREERMAAFNDLNSPAADYWDLLREPLASPDIRNWVAELPPAFEMSRDSALDFLTGDY
jgi:hypothetical protein